MCVQESGERKGMTGWDPVSVAERKREKKSNKREELRVGCGLRRMGRPVCCCSCAAGAARAGAAG